MRTKSKLQFWKVMQYTCLFAIATFYTTIKNVEANKLSRGNENNGKKAVRKGTLGFIGLKSQVLQYRRQFIVYSHDERLLMDPNLPPRVSTPEAAGYAEVHHSYEPFRVGLIYNISAKDINPTSLQSRQCKYIVEYQVEAQVKSNSTIDNLLGLPRAVAGVKWNGMDPNASDIGYALAPASGSVNLNFGNFASVSIPFISSSDEHKDTGLIAAVEVADNPNPYNEPGPMEERIQKYMQCSAAIDVDGGLYSHSDALAQVEIYIIPQSGAFGHEQFSVREAFVYPNALR